MANYCCRRTFSASFVKQTKIYCSSRPPSHTIKNELQLQKRNISSNYPNAYCTWCGCSVVNQVYQLPASVKKEQHEITNHDFISKVMPGLLLHSLLWLVLHWRETHCSDMVTGLECINGFPPKFTISVFYCVKKKFFQNEKWKEPFAEFYNHCLAGFSGGSGFFLQERNSSYILKHQTVDFFYMWFFKLFYFLLARQ